jgi:hypothetical protein
VPAPGAVGRWQLQDDFSGLHGIGSLYHQAEQLHLLQV